MGDLFSLKPENQFNTFVRDLLPEGYEYKVIKCEVYNSDETNPKFLTEIRANVNSQQDVKEFLSKFNSSSGCSFNVMSGRQDRRCDTAAAKARYRGFRKCCLNVCHKEGKENKQPGKNVACPASINFRLETPGAKYKQVKDDRQQFPLWVKVDFQHNHALNRAEYKKYLSVSVETKAVFIEMFKSGLSASSAHEERRRQIQTECPDTWPRDCADNSKLPNILSVYQLHRKWMDNTLGTRDGIDAYEKAKLLVEDFNAECLQDFPDSENKCFAKIVQSSTGETVVAIVDPFMRRVHETIPQSGDIVFMDATSNLDRNDSKVFHFVCPSPVGALPLATLITTREDTETVLFGLQVLQSVLPSFAFYGRGSTVGPVVVMTDDCDAERKAISIAWPSTTLLLCIFHVLQAQWTWLWKQAHGVEHRDKPVLLSLFRAVLYADTVDSRAKKLEEMYADSTMLKYPLYQKHLEDNTFPKMGAWSLATRVLDKLPTSNNNTNNLVECSFRYTKDIQFNRLRAFNLVDLLSLVLDKSQFYSNKCLDAANNRIHTWLKNCHSKYSIPMPDIDVKKIVELGEDCYLVPSETVPGVSYIVDMIARTCSCPQGRLHGPCKHKLVVGQTWNIPTFDLIPTKNPVIRQSFMYIATGKRMALDWFLPLQDGTIVTNQSEPVLLTSPTPNELPDSESVQVTMDIDTDMSDMKKTAREKMENTFKKLQNKLMKRIDLDPVGYSKAFDILDKTVDSLPATVDSALQKCLCSFGKTVTQV